MWKCLLRMRGPLADSQNMPTQSYKDTFELKFQRSHMRRKRSHGERSRTLDPHSGREKSEHIEVTPEGSFLQQGRHHILKTQQSFHKAPPSEECRSPQGTFAFKSQQVSNACNLQMVSLSIGFTHRHRRRSLGSLAHHQTNQQLSIAAVTVKRLP